MTAQRRKTWAGLLDDVSTDETPMTSYREKNCRCSLKQLLYPTPCIAWVLYVRVSKCSAALAETRLFGRKRPQSRPSVLVSPSSRTREGRPLPHQRWFGERRFTMLPRRLMEAIPSPAWVPPATSHLIPGGLRALGHCRSTREKW